MEWWNDLGAYYQFLNATPALAADMALSGPRGDHGFYLANSMQRTPAQLDVYPPDEMDFSGLGG